MALLVGAIAPDFRLPGWDLDQERSFHLQAQRGTAMVLAFYPGNERIVCTRQLCAYSDNLADQHRLNAQVWGISPQDVDSHRAFVAGKELRMPLLSDVDSAVATSYGVLGPLGLRRSVFVIGADGRITWCRTAALNLTFPSVADIRAALEDASAAA